MKRLFCLILGLAALLVFTGACSNDPEPLPAGSEAISNDGNVDRIAFKEITMNGCDGANAVVGVTFTSIGTGNASLKISYPSNTTTGSPNALLAEKKVDIVSNETHVDLSINAEDTEDAKGYHGGEVELNVQAGNYLVAPGEKGFQGAANVTKIADVSNENCRLAYENRTEWWHIALPVLALVVLIIASIGIARTLPKKRKVI